MDKTDETKTNTCHCPLCKSEKIEDISPRSNNGIIGPGFSSRKLADLRACKNCGMVFVPTESNQKKILRY